MGNIIKINMYAESKRKRNKKLKVMNVEKNIVRYNEWLRNTHREDKIENYEMFLEAK